MTTSMPQTEGADYSVNPVGAIFLGLLLCFVFFVWIAMVAATGDTGPVYVAGTFVIASISK